MRILDALFGQVAEAAKILGVDAEFRSKVLEARAKLAPLRIGRRGNLQEWLEDWDETEKSHRHISGLWGLFPGHEITGRQTGGAAQAARVVLEQRGLPGNGWASAWKAACWARLGDGAKALENLRFALNNYTTASLFSICSKALQVDGALGFSAAIAEMLLRSQNGEIEFLPALPSSWRKGEVRGLRARGGFEIDMKWSDGRLWWVTILSTAGGTCRVRLPFPMSITHSGQMVMPSSVPDSGVVEFRTQPGFAYVLAPR
jgi:alpha-L-fucosidase 2